MLIEWKDNSKIPYDDITEFAREIPVYNLGSTTKLVAFMIGKQKTDHPVLNKDVPEATVCRISVTETDKFCHTRWLASEKVDSD